MGLVSGLLPLWAGEAVGKGKEGSETDDICGGGVCRQTNRRVFLLLKGGSQPTVPRKLFLALCLRVTPGDATETACGVKDVTGIGHMQAISLHPRL